eukprot:4944267-Prymnesium_polylepis.1
MPRGTAMIGLLLTKKSVGVGAYEQYHLLPPQLERLFAGLASGVRWAQRRHRRPRPVPLAASRPCSRGLILWLGTHGAVEELGCAKGYEKV